MGTATSTIAYGYTDQQWGDLLTSYNGQTFAYDEIGNLTNDGTWAYTWKQGRQLAQMTQGATTWTYTYDDKGLRTQRTNGTETYNYIYSGGLLRAMMVDGHSFIFRYGADGRPYSVQYDGEDYFYVLNAQGDVLAIVDGNGANAAVYTYNAWGNVMSSFSSTLAQLNPLRYRGYVYDQETGLYYLQSRYYNPEWGRFINADGLLDTRALAGLNLFAYCLNNPVNLSDKTGYEAFGWWIGTMWWLGTIDGPLPIGDLIFSVGAVIFLCEAVDPDNSVSDILEESTYSYQPPSPDNDDDDDYYNDDDNFVGKEPIGVRRGNTPRNNRVQNRQYKAVTKNLSYKAKDSLHPKIRHKGYGYHELVDEVKGLHGLIVWLFLPNDDTQ